MQITRRQTTRRRQAFALPTVLIASIVLLTILAVSVTATAAVRTTLKTQYYVQLAQVAGESGVAFAKACLAANGNVPTWTDAKPLTPATDCNGNVILSPNVKALIVAGGGSGGGSTGGGGGAGGLIYNESVPIDEDSYAVTVGDGGAAPGNQTHGKNGGNSSFNDLTAIGGGGGGTSSSNSSADSAGNNGGSGGGGQSYHANYASGNGTSGQGYPGGGVGGSAGAGGGGAGGPGVAAVGSNSNGGDGGPGVQNNITGAMIYYAAGGAGAANANAGTGGSGNASSSAQNAVGAAGRPNSGDGGGAGWNYTGGNGGAGGSGVVIISFPVNSGIDAEGGAVTVSNGNEIHKFTSNGTFTVNSAGSSTCPSDPRCSVTVNGNVRSSFSVPKPTVDASGKALTILNNGYTEITRTSNGSVWRTYRQPSVQNTVVPDLCSGNASAIRGWSSAVKASQQDTIAATTTAQTIGISTGAVNAGTMYFRKDFNVSRADSYDLNLYTNTSQDGAIAYVDGTQIAATTGGLATKAVTLTPGCHVMVVKLQNNTVLPRQSDFTASLGTKNSATPLVVTDTSWRVTAGDAAHFSTTNYEETSAWEPVYVVGAWNDTSVPLNGRTTGWNTASGESSAQIISTANGVNSSTAPRPFNAYAWFRSQQFTVSGTANVNVSTVCDDGCDVYLDGNLVFRAQLAQNIVNETVTLSPGAHQFGLRLYNGGTSDNGSYFVFAATDTDSGTVYSRSNASWRGSTSWTTTAGDPSSFDKTFRPTPSI